MTVTGIEAISKTRSKVYLDGQFAFVLYKGELRKYRIEEGEELDEAAVEELRTRILPKRAKMRAMNLLQTKRYTEKQLLDKLLLGGYSIETAREALTYVKSYRYVDDAGYARDYIACHIGGHSLKEMEQKLLLRGIDRQLIRSVVQDLEEDGIVSDETAMIRKILAKKQYVKETADEKEKRRIYGYLYRKGFSAEAVRKVMGEESVWDGAD